MLEQQRCGNELRQTVLPRVLGAEFCLLGTESLFGVANGRFRSRLPLALAFGYELGRTFAAQPSTDGAAAQPVFELAALFNLGISMFDLLLDSMPKAASGFSASFDRRTLSHLHDDGEAIEAVLNAAASAAEPETRILLRIIASFYAGLYAFVPEQSRSESRKPLRLLMAAYEAEIASTRAHTRTRAQQLQISRSKSTLPFLILNEIGRLGRGVDHPAQERLDEVASAVGTLFWLVDDLADLVDDLGSGAVNAVVLRGAKRRGDLDGTARSVVESKALERTVREIVAAFDTIVAATQDPLFAGTTAESLRSLIGVYVRSWLE